MGRLGRSGHLRVALDHPRHHLGYFRERRLLLTLRPRTLGGAHLGRAAGEVRADREAKPGVTNLLEILAAVTGGTVEDAVAAHGGGGYGALKAAVAEAVVEHLRPIRARHAELAADPAEVGRVLAAGAERARAVAAPTLARARDAMGFLAPA